MLKIWPCIAGFLLQEKYTLAHACYEAMNIMIFLVVLQLFGQCIVYVRLELISDSMFSTLVVLSSANSDYTHIAQLMTTLLSRCDLKCDLVN